MIIILITNLLSYKILKKKKNLRYQVEHLCAYNVSNYNSNYLNKIKKKKL